MYKSITSVLKIAAVAVVATVGLRAAPANADDFDPKDGRVAPAVADRVAVYCHDDGVEVWGVDSSNNGVYLTKFSEAELVAGSATHSSESGSISLTQNRTATTVQGYSSETAEEIITHVEESAEYTIAWSGGNYGANGEGVFSKTIECTYLP
jgi:hypothetical protein